MKDRLDPSHASIGCRPGPAHAGLIVVVCLLSAVGLLLPRTADAAPDSLSWTAPPPDFTRAALEVVGTNVLVWSFDRFIREGGKDPEFRIGTNSIWENMKNRFEWDNNNFSTNAFDHPFHGSLYFTAARSNGFGYWESIPFAFGGSYLWEFAGERNNPAYNDWINTSVGGVGLGESLYRLSNLVLDNRATGTERFWRELGGLAISPMRGVNRLISGEWSRIGPTPLDWRPNSLGFRLEGGFRSQSRDRVGSRDTTGAFVGFEFLYGDPFEKEVTHPFDHFSFGAQVNFGDVSKLGRVQSEGLLLGRTVRRSGNVRHVLGVNQSFEYVDNRGYVFGGQNVGATVLSRFGDKDAGLMLETELCTGLLLLGATSSEVANFSGRDYDYGPGLSIHAGARLHRKGRLIARFRTESEWLYTLNGVDGHYIVTITQLQGAIPLRGDLGFGAEVRGYYRKAFYKNFEDVSHWLPEGRVFFTLASY